MMGHEKVNLGLLCVWREDITKKQCLSPDEGGNTNDSFSLYHSRFSWRPKDTWREPRGAEKEMPWAGPLLLSWAVLLGWREIMAFKQCCRETSLARSSSSDKHNRAEGTACRH